MNHVWIIEDDSMYAQMLKQQIEKSGDFVADVYNEAEKILNKGLELPRAVFLDYQLPGDNGTKVLEFLHGIDSELPIVIVSGQEDPNVAVKLIKKGAYDYVTKTADTPRQLASILAKLSKQIRMKEELEVLRSELGKKRDLTDVMGSSAAVSKLAPLYNKASNTGIAISLTGDSGVGKETLARAIHENSQFGVNQFVSVPMGSLPSKDVESFLCGRMDNDTFVPGAFEQAKGGTIYLDEISDIDTYNQTKLLHMLQTGKYVPVNGTEQLSIDCRIISSTNKNMKELVKTGAFREDLYFRLLGLPIHIPSLKDRRGDILVFARDFANTFCRSHKMNLLRFDKEAQDKLLDYNWPGNVRELMAVVELACVMAEGEYIKAEDIRYEETSPSDDLLSKERSLREYTSMIIEYFLQKYEGDIPKVASVLEIGKSTIYRMLKNNEITLP